jgi:hypothetical protein
MAVRLWNPYIGIAQNSPADRIIYIVQMKVPREEAYDYPMVALSDYTTDRRLAESWLLDLRVKAGRYLRDTRNK